MMINVYREYSCICICIGGSFWKLVGFVFGKVVFLEFVAW
jgi:hypothetical protein